MPSESKPGGIRRWLSHPLVGHSSVFVGAEFINKGLPFLLLPVLTRVLTTADYGIVATFLALQSILAVAVGLSTHGGVSVAFFRLNQNELKNYISAVLGILASTVIIAAVIIVFISPFISSRLGFGLIWLLLADLVAGSQFLTQINLVLWQCEARPKAYAMYQLGQTLFGVCLTLLFVLGMRLGWRGQLYSLVGANLSFATISLVFLWRRGYIGAQILRSDVREALAFGVPLIPHALSGWVITGIDRFFLTTLMGAAVTGLYAAGFQIALVISVLATAFNRAWSPYLLRSLKDATPEKERLLVKICYTYFIVILGLALLLALVAPPLATLILGPRFKGAAGYIFWIALGYSFNGMYMMVVAPIFYAKRTGVLASITFLVALAHVGLSYTLIRYHGTAGAAQATAISFGLQFALVWLASSRIHPLPWLLCRV